MRISFNARCLATLEETWEADVPDGLEGDELVDAVLAALFGPNSTAEFIREQSSDEHDRELLHNTIERKERPT